MNRNWFSSCKCRELQAVRCLQQETSWWFCKTLTCNMALLAVCSSNGKKWVKVRLLLSKPCSFFIQLYLSILHKESSTSFKQCPVAEFHGENVKGNWFNVNDCHGAIYNALTSGVNGLRSNSRLRKLFFLVVFF